jgi:hypothetical protein
MRAYVKSLRTQDFRLSSLVETGSIADRSQFLKKEEKIMKKLAQKKTGGGGG